MASVKHLSLVLALFAVGVAEGGTSGDPNRDLGGPAPLKTLYQWRLADFAYESNATRQADIDSRRFIPAHSVPLGIETWRDRVFLTFPKWKEGVPATLATVPKTPKSRRDASPNLQPYPNWDFHQPKSDCSGLTSVFRIKADGCGRLWVLDTGLVNVLTEANQLCPPQLFVFNLTTDALIARHRIPAQFVTQNSLFTNIITDVRDDQCDDLHAYMADTTGFAIVVFRLSDASFWRFTSHLFYPDPIASDYTLQGINWQWSDGVFGLALGPVRSDGDRTLFFHPLSSFREFTMPASVLRNSTAPGDSALVAASVKLAGESRGFDGQSTTEQFDRNGVLFFAMASRDAIGCWDSRKPYKKTTLGIVARDDEQLIFPSDLKVDYEQTQRVWVLSGRLPIFLFRQLDPNDVNIRVMRASVKRAVAGTVCDPRQRYCGPFEYEPECY